MKLFKSLTILITLTVSLSSCALNSLYSVDDALEIILDYGVDTSSWKGIKLRLYTYSYDDWGDEIDENSMELYIRASVYEDRYSALISLDTHTSYINSVTQEIGSESSSISLYVLENAILLRDKYTSGDREYDNTYAFDGYTIDMETLLTQGVYFASLLPDLVSQVSSYQQEEDYDFKTTIIKKRKSTYVSVTSHYYLGQASSYDNEREFYELNYDKEQYLDSYAISYEGYHGYNDGDYSSEYCDIDVTNFNSKISTPNWVNW